ncbi:MAG: PAS domain S-box protein [Methylocaldum sp.]|nr:PAS domain S-box protein [Methylocaldum sp.]
MTDIDFDRSGHSVFVFGTDTEKTVRQIVLLLLPLGLFSFGLWLCVQEHGVRFADYSALHTLVEIPAIVIAAMVFGIGWNAYEENRPLTLPILACGFLTVGLLDLMHVLSFPGMPNFITPSSPEKAINFWLSARYLAAVTFLAAGLLPWRPMKRLSFRCAILAGCLAFASLIVWLGLFREDFWPRTFLSGQGLTPFKMKAEYALTLIYFTVTLVLLYRLRRPQPRVLAYLMGASAVTALSELCFSRYRAVDDLCNFVGHVYKAIAYFLVYRGIFVEGVHEPYLRLQASREALRKSEARFQDLLEFEPDGVLLADSACRIAMANAKAEAIFACPRAELIGRSIETLIPEICRAKHSARWHTHRKEKQTLSVGREVWGRRNDGSDFPAEVTLGPLHTEQGLMTIVAVRDIT